MPNAICNTSPLLYLYRIGVLEWLSALFDEVWVPQAVVDELQEGQLRGYDVPVTHQLGWIRIVNPKAMPSEWLALDLGPGELAVLALALENPEYVVLIDDTLARRTAQSAGLKVWGTLRVLLEAKSHGLTEQLEPYVNRLQDAGMWMSEEIRQRILALDRKWPMTND
ncbi:MAG: DUF3368 domain-containing protein [Candidatus Hadarchaeum sp.]